MLLEGLPFSKNAVLIKYISQSRIACEIAGKQSKSWRQSSETNKCTLYSHSRNCGRPIDDWITQTDASQLSNTPLGPQCNAQIGTVAEGDIKYSSVSCTNHKEKANSDKFLIPFQLWEFKSTSVCLCFPILNREDNLPSEGYLGSFSLASS